MGSFSIWHWLIVLAVVLVLFGGGGKIPKLMRDMGQGINAFKRGLKEEDKEKGKGKDSANSDPHTPIENESTVSARVEEKDKAASG